MSINFRWLWPNKCPMGVKKILPLQHQKASAYLLWLSCRLCCFWCWFPYHSCRLFKKLADDSDVLKAVAFDRVTLTGIHESFWQPAGLLSRCLQTGNPTAFNAIRKVHNSSVWGISASSTSVVQYGAFSSFGLLLFYMIAFLFGLLLKMPVLQNAEILNASYLILKRAMFRGKMVKILNFLCVVDIYISQPFSFFLDLGLIIMLTCRLF